MANLMTVVLKDTSAPKCLRSDKSIAMWNRWRGKTINVGLAQPNVDPTGTCDATYMYAIKDAQMLADLSNRANFNCDSFSPTICEHMIDHEVK